MKLPAVWMAVALGAGIGLSTFPPAPLKFWGTAAVAALLAGCILAWRNRVAAAGTCALLTWLALGGFTSTIERLSVPPNNIARLIAAKRIDTTVPLRWRGRLREDPLHLPWGRRYEIDLEQVEVAGAILPVSGGLRANLYNDPGAAGGPPRLRAGDRVEALLRAQPPRNFLDPGAFDLQGYLARQQIDLTGSLRSGALLHLIDRPPPTLLQRLARVRGNLLGRIDALFPGQSRRAAVLRAMLLGDRSFVDSDTVTAFQKTAAYHVLVVAGLHVGALAVLFFWLCRRLRFSVGVTTMVTLTALATYVSVVQDRPPILRATLMAAVYLCARPLFRRIELLNTIALTAMLLLLWKPFSLSDPSFQLSFLATGVIAGLALPWIDRTSEPYRNGLRHLGDATRDGVHLPKIAQFRIELRAAVNWIASKLHHRLAPRVNSFLLLITRVALRVWEIVLLSVLVQWGITPLLAQDFHRVSLAGPISNIPAVILTSVIVPLGFLALLATFFWVGMAKGFAVVLGLCVRLLLGTIEWFSRLPRVSYRIPGPPLWLTVLFFTGLILLAALARSAAARWRTRAQRRRFSAPKTRLEWMTAAVLFALTVLIVSHPFPPALASGRLEVTVLDVGQGDSIFLAFPDGRTMLIDGGGLENSEWAGGYRSGIDVGEEVVSPYLWSRGIQHLDVVALTHAHHDHIDGLHSVLQNFHVRELWIGRDEETPAFENLLTEARARGLRIVHRTRGAQFDWDGVQGEVLWPPDTGPVRAASNDDSMVLRISDGRLHFLLPGDAQKHSENQLVADHMPLAADFLKVPHHGSKTSSTEAFLGAVAPRIAVVSVGRENSFGQPAESVLDRYASDNVRLLRTDRDGAVTAIADGQHVSVRTFVEDSSR
jgi:competence protein ComEC